MTANTDDDNIEIIGGDDSLVVDDAGGMVVVDADNDRLQRYVPAGH